MCMPQLGGGKYQNTGYTPHQWVHTLVCCGVF